MTEEEIPCEDDGKPINSQLRVKPDVIEYINKQRKSKGYSSNNAALKQIINEWARLKNEKEERERIEKKTGEDLSEEEIVKIINELSRLLRERRNANA
jgi:hypothetical protein